MPLRFHIKIYYPVTNPLQVLFLWGFFLRVLNSINTQRILSPLVTRFVYSRIFSCEQSQNPLRTLSFLLLLFPEILPLPYSSSQSRSRSNYYSEVCCMCHKRPSLILQKTVVTSSGDLLWVLCSETSCRHPWKNFAATLGNLLRDP